MDKFQVETAQNIQITQNIAGLGARIGAFTIDLLILIIYETMAGYLLSYIDFNWTPIKEYAVISAFLIPLFFYHLAMETLNNGQSVGKMLVNIRVVTLDGRPARLSHYTIRWLLRLFDIALSSGGLAIFVFLMNGKGQRLGDIAAKTTVISEKKRISLEDTILIDLPPDYLPEYPQVTVFSDNEMQTIKELYEKARREGDSQVITNLSEKIANVMEIPATDTSSYFIERVLNDYNYYTQQ